MVEIQTGGARYLLPHKLTNLITCNIHCEVAVTHFGCVFAHAKTLNCFMPMNGDLLSAVPESVAFVCVLGIVALSTFH